MKKRIFSASFLFVAGTFLIQFFITNKDVAAQQSQPNKMSIVGKVENKILCPTGVPDQYEWVVVGSCVYNTCINGQGSCTPQAPCTPPSGACPDLP